MWSQLKRRKKPYELTRLIDFRRLHAQADGGLNEHIVCDIDKTYLETQFESWIQLAKTAFESAGRKTTVQGASELLMALRWGAPQELDSEDLMLKGLPRPLHFVSSSPSQMRSVVEEKLVLDGLDWSSDTYKNQAYNLMMGRMDLLRHHIAYKSAAILQLFQNASEPPKFYLIGDNAESDAYIYLGIHLFTSGRLDKEGYRQFLEYAGVESDVAAGLAVGDYASAKVAAILIRNVPGYRFVFAPPLTYPIFLFDNFYAAALIFIQLRVLSVASLWGLTRAFHNRFGFSREDLLQPLYELQESSEVSAEIKEECSKIIGKLLRAGVLIKGNAGSTSALSLAGEKAREEAEFNNLTSEQILNLAKLWIDKIRAAHKTRGET